MVPTALFIIFILVVAVLALLVLLHRKLSQSAAPLVQSRLDAFEKTQERTERAIKEEIALNRGELGKTASEQRQELSGAFKTLGDSVVQRLNESAGAQKAQLEAFATQLISFANTSRETLDSARTESATMATQLRQEIVATLTGISEAMAKTLKELATAEQLQLSTFSANIGALADSNEKKLEAVRATLEVELKSMKSENATQLEQMRQTVDEKLQGTLEKRLGESFKQVSERLELVHKGLGEMQLLATGVGDLKKVLTNVTTRGTWGEVQLGALFRTGIKPGPVRGECVAEGNRRES